MYITLKNINKNLISGIKLVKERYSYEIKNKNGNNIFYLKPIENKKVIFFWFLSN